jgi:hypothetical protein
MMGALVIARYEITRRWTLWLIALGLGLIPVIVGAGHGYAAHFASDIEVTWVVLSWVFAFVVGMSLVGNPLHDGRLSFYFTRPLRASAIVGGKIVGGLLLVAGIEALLAVPRLFRADQIEPGAQIFAALAAIAFLAVGLVVGILARSRSRWFAADAVGVSIASAVIVLMFVGIGNLKTTAVTTLEYPEAREAVERVDRTLVLLFGGAVLVVIAAVIAAVAAGRTDRERVHRALSLTLWPAITATAAAGILYAHWGP